MKYIVITIVCLVGALAIWICNPHVGNTISSYIENGEFLTLEVKFNPEQIVDTYRDELLTDERYTLKDASLKFVPYLLLEIKYTQGNKKTREGCVLWSQVDGEMVLDTDTWETTHGFADAIKANATNAEFLILNALAKHRGSLSRDQLQKELHFEGDALDPWIDSARKKHLVIQKGNELQLHFQNPKILVHPETKLSQQLVSKPYSYMNRLGRKYSQTQIEKVAKAAFGQDFTVRETKDVFLPVCCIEVLNPDGSTSTSYWNALNGEKILPNYMAKL